MRSEEIRFCHILNGPIYIKINMAYWVLPFGINQRGYSTSFEASTQCYPLPGCIAYCVISSEDIYVVHEDFLRRCLDKA